MIKLDDNLLQELGLGSLPPEEKKKMLAHIYETLEMRVGMELAKQMTDQQLSEFEAFIGRNDEAGALHWLETNFPNYKEVVAAEFEKLKLEIRQVAPQIVASSQQQMAAQQQYQAQMPMQPQGQQPYYGPQQQPYIPQQRQDSYPPQNQPYPPYQQGQQPPQPPVAPMGANPENNPGF